MSHYPAVEGEGAQEGWKADLIKDSNFVAKSDEWLVLLLGPNVQVGTLRLFTYAALFVVIGATLAYVVR